jgi:hypothetical protein
VNGGAYCNPTLVARYPEPQTVTKNQASQRLESESCVALTPGFLQTPKPPLRHPAASSPSRGERLSVN